MLATIERVDRLAIVGMVRDRNTIAAYDAVKASELALTKVVGYTAVVSALAPRLDRDGSVLLFRGAAKDRERRKMLQQRGLGTIYDYVDEHPSGAMRSHQDEAFPIVF